jgi:MFS family permease
VDAVHRKRLVLAAALAVTGFAALLLGKDAQLVPVLAAEIMHAAAATVIMPAIAAVTLTVCRSGEFGERLGSNTKWASIGSAAAAILIEPLASYLGSAWVFPLTAVLCLAAALTVLKIHPAESDKGITEAHPALMHPKACRQHGHRFWAMYTETHL